MFVKENHRLSHREHINSIIVCVTASYSSICEALWLFVFFYMGILFDVKINFMYQMCETKLMQMNIKPHEIWKEKKCLFWNIFIAVDHVWNRTVFR